MGRGNHYVLVTGGRDPDEDTLRSVGEVLNFLHLFYEGTLRVMHGGARGVDTAAADICGERGVPVKAFPADWGRGKQAGIERNRKMGELLESWIDQGHSGEVIAFRGGRGTANMVAVARELGLPLTELPVYEEMT